MERCTRGPRPIAATYVWLFFAAAALPLTSHASELDEFLPADLTLKQLIAQSLAAVPELSSARDNVRAASERVPQAGAWPDPMLQVGLQNMGFTSIEIGKDPTSFVSVMASQTFPWPGKVGLRREVAEAGTSQAKATVARIALSTEADVRRAYLDLLLVRDRLALLDQLDAIWQKSLGVVRARYEAGNGAQSDVLRAQLEINRIKQRRFALQAEERTAVHSLNRLRNHPLDERVDTETRIRALPTPRSLEGRFSFAPALELSPELTSARFAVERARTSAELAEKGDYPDLTVGAGAMVRGPLPPMWLVTVGGPLPVFSARKQTRAIAERRALENAAQGEVAALEQRLRLRSQERHAVFDSLVQTVELYEQGLLVQSEATTESTLTQYKVGGVSFASVLEANAGFIADEEGYLQAIVAAHRVLIAEAELSLSPVAMPTGMGSLPAAMPGAGPSSPATSASPAGRGESAPPGSGSMSNM